jgi:ABC-type uncharacterized transport system substrate-binding protein
VRRREFIALVGGAAACPIAARGQQAAIPVIGFLGAESPAISQHFLDAFRQGLREYGYVEGQNITLEARWAEGRSERFPELVDELVRLKTTVILTVSVAAALAAKNRTTTIPIVFIAIDPVGLGLVPSLARPGGNLTGMSLFLGEEFSGKWLELLRDAVPQVSRVAVLLNPANPTTTGYAMVLRGAAQKLGVELHFQEVTHSDQFENAFGTIVAQRAQALVVIIDPLTVHNRGRIVELAMKYHLPAMYGFREFVDAGGLIAYGVSVSHLCRRAGIYVDKILKGVEPGDIPVEQPTAFELVINLKTARALGITVPPSLLARADEVIE